MSAGFDPAEYHAWYQSRRGQWIAGREFELLTTLLQPAPGASLLDVGCGTGHFSRRFAHAGLQVTGLDPDADALRFASARDATISYTLGDARSLPFRDGCFDHAAAITSLCFVDRPIDALKEMWRVSRRSMVLGLLNCRSLLYLQKRGRGGYLGARWDDSRDLIDRWIVALDPPPSSFEVKNAIFLPSSAPLARWLENLLPPSLPFGGFLAVCIHRQSS